MRFNYSLFACLLLLNCSKSNDPSNVADAQKCLLTGITSDGISPAPNTITYASGKIVNVSTELPAGSKEIKLDWDYTYSDNKVSIKSTYIYKDPISGDLVTSYNVYDIILQNGLPIQVSENGKVLQKLYYSNSKLKYVVSKSDASNVDYDSAVVSYDVKGENIIAVTRYQKKFNTMQWDTFGSVRQFVLDTKTNPLKSIFLFPRPRTISQGGGIQLEYFNTNNIISTGRSKISYLYGANNLPIQISEEGSATFFLTYKCP